MPRMTLQEAREMYDIWLECERELATGQAKHYRVGTREYTALDLDEVRKSQKRWGDIVAELEGRSNGRQARTVVFRDT